MRASWKRSLDAVAVAGLTLGIEGEAAEGAVGAGPNFSPAIRVGNRLFVSGGTGTTDASQGGMAAQTTETLDRLGRSLQAAGFDWTDVVASDVYITDVSRFGEMNGGYRPRFQTDPPVRATAPRRSRAQAHA